MNIIKATAAYESWLATQVELVPNQLDYKHAQMSQAVFPFFRGAFYRWAQRWSEESGDAADAPRVRAVGDLHIENFGTWRDEDGRLAWGVNDFDEAYELPYTFDLVRLTASAILGGSSDAIYSPRMICQAILGGYRDGLRAGGWPFILGEKHGWLNNLANSDARNPVSFWQKMREAPPVDQPIPAAARELIESVLPSASLPYHLVARLKGMGSLGHPRYTAVAEYRGGSIAREAKAIVPSACAWLEEPRHSGEILYAKMLQSAVRSPDPLFRIAGKWLVRRIAPDCTRIELATLARSPDEGRLLRAMGWETANIHLGSPDAAKEIRRDLRRRPADWLRKTARKMIKFVRSDWEEWRAARPESSRPKTTRSTRATK